MLTEYYYEDLTDFAVNTEYWYWLENVSTSGTSDYFGPISITSFQDEPESPDIPEIMVKFCNYPNPFNPETYIRFNVTESKGKLNIFNINGKFGF